MRLYHKSASVKGSVMIKINMLNLSIQEKFAKILDKICSNLKEGLIMKKINLNGITSESVAGVIFLLVALVNAVFQMFGVKTIPIENEEISAIVSGFFLIITSLWNTWKNRNISTASQLAQSITDSLKNGEILEEDIRTLMNKIRK